MNSSSNLGRVGQLLQHEADELSSSGVQLFVADKGHVVGEGLDVPADPSTRLKRLH